MNYGGAQMAAELELGLEPGEIIAGKYEIVREIQAGSMGTVYVCKNHDFEGHLVAVKVLLPEVAANQTACARLQQEIYSSYLVTHPNIVRTFEYLKDGELIGYSMEYVDGGDLADRLERGENFSPSQVAEILMQVCAGVHAMHRADIVHRDIKPENILFKKDGTVKITDFGIVRMGNGPKLTERGGVVGTIAYMSPEYLLKGEADKSCDIYAIGVLGYEMLTGHPPSEGKSAMECMQKRLHSAPVPPSELVRCPAALEEIILKALERSPEDRFQSAEAMQAALQQFLMSEHEDVPLPRTPLLAGGASPQTLDFDEERRRRRTRSMRTTAIRFIREMLAATPSDDCGEDKEYVEISSQYSGDRLSFPICTNETAKTAAGNRVLGRLCGLLRLMILAMLTLI